MLSQKDIEPPILSLLFTDRHPISWLSLWSLEMDAHIKKTIPDDLIEILPPDRHDCHAAGMKTCLCCAQTRPESAMDDDGCGICEECLSP